MRRLGFGLIAFAATAALAATEPANNLSPASLDLVTLQGQQFDADNLARAKPYRLTLSLVPTRAQDTAIDSRLGDAPRLSPVLEAPKGAIWVTSSSSSRLFDGGQAVWLPLLRLETKGERLEIKPRRHSLSIQWTKRFN